MFEEESANWTLAKAFSFYFHFQSPALPLPLSKTKANTYFLFGCKELIKEISQIPISHWNIDWTLLSRRALVSVSCLFSLFSPSCPVMSPTELNAFPRFWIALSWSCSSSWWSPSFRSLIRRPNCNIAYGKGLGWNRVRGSGSVRLPHPPQQHSTSERSSITSSSSFFTHPEKG